MLITDVQVISNKQISIGTYLLEVESEKLSKLVLPGQFFNIQVSNSSYPLLRRPFSISNVLGNSLFFMYKIVGEGTEIMSLKKKGDTLNILGPLGNSFSYHDSFDEILIIGGGIGIAPFPYLIQKFKSDQKYSVLFGVRNKDEVHDYGLQNIHYSSDDGSIGLKGNAIDLLKIKSDLNSKNKVKIYSCGPNAMFRSLKEYLSNTQIECEISMESAMACGFGICQGCPIDHTNDEKYKLICKDGPIFNIRDVVI